MVNNITHNEDYRIKISAASNWII